MIPQQTPQFLMKIIHRYILREVFYYFFVLLTIFTTILLDAASALQEDEEWLRATIEALQQG